MANTPEGKIKDKIKTLCKKYAPDVYYHMPVQNGMGKPTLDFIVCAYGRFIGVEAKAPGKGPTPRQVQTMKEMTDAGGYVALVDGDKSLEVLEFLIMSCKAD